VPGALDRAIALLTDGAPIDWTALLRSAADDRERSLIDDLRALSQFEITSLPGGDAAGTIGVAPPAPDAVRQRWAHLELLEPIGRGAHGVVYRAWDTRLAREVALKLLGPDTPRGSIEEARRLARVSHPGVVTIYGADYRDGQIGLWIELLRGRTLDAMLAEYGPFSAREAIGIGREICSAVAAIHAGGLIHRDLKAQNVMREPGGRIVVMDMSISVEGSPLNAELPSLSGTPLYMAPELFAGSPASVASDVYAIGVLLYRLVTAAFPVDGPTVGDVRRAHAAGRIRSIRDVRSDLPIGYVHVVERCLRPVPSDRFNAVSALERALHGADEGIKGSPGARAGVSSVVAVCAIGAVALGAAIEWNVANRRVVPATAATTERPAVTPEDYRALAAYEELAFAKLETDPAAAAALTRSAFSLLRPSMPGPHLLFASLYSRLSEASRRAGNLRQADASRLDAAAHALESSGGDHPLWVSVRLEAARNAQAGGEYPTAAAEMSRALAARWRVLGMAQPASGASAFPDVAELARGSQTASAGDDRDHDGLMDLIEAVTGLNPSSGDSDGDGIPDEEEPISTGGFDNAFAFGLPTSPFLTWAQYGAYEPRSLGWQPSPNYPIAGRAQAGGSLTSWSIEATQAIGYFFQRLSPAMSERAIKRGFTIFVRVQPISGLATVAVDTAPAGPRFDLFMRRLNDHEIEVRLPSSVVPRDGPIVLVEATTEEWPVVELRYRPRWRAAALYVNGRRFYTGYAGHHQFQAADEGAVSWGGAAADGNDHHATAQYGLVWLQIF
jgi:hypothetical protein